MSIDERVAKLERSNRLLRASFIAIVAVTGFAVISGADDRKQAPTLISAEAFQLVGRDGKGRGMLAVVGDTTMLRLGGDDDRHTYFAYSKDGSELSMSHPDTSKKIFAKVSRDGVVGVQVNDGERVLWSAP